MNLSQVYAADLVSNGHNLYIGGQAGSGKSFIAREVVSHHTAIGKCVGLTCTTGVACSIYPKHMKPMTIHKWAGLSDGRFSDAQLVKLLKKDDKYEGARERIISTDLLIVDEISMLSVKMYEQLEFVLRHVRNINMPFGGMQVVLLGDFVQLPPVRNSRYSDVGDFCFESSYFPVHRVFLGASVRQSDKLFCDIIRKISMGHMDDESKNFINDHCHPLSKTPDLSTTRLYSQNIMADMFNRDITLNMQGPLYSFDSIDEGEDRYLNLLVVPKTLWLKANSRVMLLRNLTDELVNGLQGDVLTIREGEVDVYFPSLDKVETLSRVNFTVFDPDSGRNLAVRSQIPLKLSYAMTIHKAQGMTLDRVEVDCRQIFQPGQLGVALGRVKSAEGLRVINFTTDAVIKQPESVIEFLQQESKPVVQDLSCCHKCCQQEDFDNQPTCTPLSTASTVIAPNDCDVDDLQATCELNDDEIDDEIRQIDLENIIHEIPQTVPLPESYDYLGQLKKLRFEDPTRKSQDHHNSLIDQMIETESSTQEFLTTLYSWIAKMYDQNFGSDTNVHKTKQQTAFFVDFQKFATSSTYKSICIDMFPVGEDYDVVFSLCHQIISVLRELYIQKKAQKLPTDDTSETLKTRSFEVNQDMTDGAKGKIRYVAGYVIAKLRYSNMMKVKRSAFRSSRDHLLNYEHGKRCLSLLECFKASEYSLQNSQYSGSLEETKRKQNLNRGLTNVTDDFYLLFTEIVSEILQLLVSENVTSKGTELFMFVKESLSSNIDIYQKYLSQSVLYKAAELTAYELEVDRKSVQADEAVIDHCVKDMLTMIDVMDDLYSSILDKTISVLLKQFSKDLIGSFNLKKKMEHRKQIHMSTTKSTSQTQSQSRKKCESEQEASGAKKPRLGKSTRKNSAKPTPPVSLKTSHVHSSTVASSSAEPLEGDDNICAKCYKNYNENEEWVCCDGCLNWYHRNCAGLSSVLKWKKYKKPNTAFYCHQCQ